MVLSNFLPHHCYGYTPTCVGGETGSIAALVEPLSSEVLFFDEDYVEEPRPWGTFCCNPDFINVSSTFWID